MYFSHTPALLKRACLFSLSCVLSFWSSGQVLDWAHVVGPGYLYSEDGLNMQVDADSNLIIISTITEFDSLDIDPASQVQVVKARGYSNTIIQKFDASGNLIWHHSISSNVFNEAVALDVDDENNILVLGSFAGTVDFDPGAEEFLLAGSSAQESISHFLLKLNADGEFIWAREIDRLSYRKENKSIAALPDGSTLVFSDYQRNVDADPGPGIVPYFSSSEYSGFLTKLDPMGFYEWSVHFSSDSILFPLALESDADGKAYACFVHVGNTEINGTNISQPVNLTATQNAGSHLISISDEGKIEWMKGFDGRIGCENIYADNAQNLYVSGVFFGNPDFDFSDQTFTLNSIGNDDGFILKMSDEGQFEHAIQFNERARPSITSNGIYNRIETDFREDIDPGPDTVEVNAYPNQTAVIFVQLTKDLELLDYKTYSQQRNVSTVNGWVAGPNGEAYTAGMITEEFDFDPELESVVKSAPGGLGNFLFKLWLFAPPLGISAITENPSHRIYPNPAADDRWYLTFEEVQESVSIDLYAANGQRIRSLKANQVSSLEVATPETPGIYFMKVSTTERESTHRLIKQ